MNLTMEVRDGILNHTGSGVPITLEGRIVRTADRIAYINHDIDDALRSGVIHENDLPREPITYLGNTTNKRIDTLIRDMIAQSDGLDDIRQSPEAKGAMEDLRAWLFEHVYLNPFVKKEDEIREIERTIHGLYAYFLARPEELPAEYAKLVPEDGVPEIAKDHVASMTDRFATELWRSLAGGTEI